MDAITELSRIHLPDSWVLGVETSASSVSFVLDAALSEEHPRFYSPPNEDERHAYVKLCWRIEGSVHWNEGPNLRNPAVDATGEPDFGHVDVWIQLENRDMLEGDWGNVVIGKPTHAITYMD